MAGQRQPTSLILHKGKKHFSKEELEKRREREITAPCDNILAPKYLTTAAQREKFTKTAKSLQDIGIMSNLDCDALARYIQSEEKYLKYDKLVNAALKEAKTLEKAASLVTVLEKLEGLRDKALKQCRGAAADLGLTISSRCKLVAPKLEKAADPHAGMFGDGESDTG